MIKSKNRIMIVASIAIILLWILLGNTSIFNNTNTESLVEIRDGNIDCNACPSKVEGINTIEVYNSDPSRTYYVWQEGVFQGEFAAMSEFKQMCGSQLNICYSDTACPDYACQKNNRVMVEFSCNDQTIVLK